MAADSDVGKWRAKITYKETTMKLPSNKIEVVADKEPSRYTLNAVQVDVEHKRVMATNGHILAIVPCEVSPEDHSALMSLETVKAVRAMQKRAKSAPITVTTNNKITAEGNGERIEHEVVTGRFPNVDMVVPKFDGPPTITLSVDLLYRIAEAVHSNPIGKDNPGSISLWIKDAQSAVLVKSSEDEDKAIGAVGVIMPCRP